MLTPKQREYLEARVRVGNFMPYTAEAILAAFETIDVQAAELALLRQAVTPEPYGYPVELCCDEDCGDARCHAWREWKAKYGGAR